MLDTVMIGMHIWRVQGKTIVANTPKEAREAYRIVEAQNFASEKRLPKGKKWQH